MVTDTPIKIQIVKSLSNLKPSRMIAVKADNETTFSLYVTDKTGIPYPLKDLQGSGSGIVNITNTDGTITVTGGSSTKYLKISDTIQALINGALQSGDNISELINDTGFITSSDLSNLVPYTGATQNADLGEFQIKAGQIELDQTPTGTFGVGKIRWNDTAGTAEIRLKGNNVTLQVGQELVKRVVNKTVTNVNLLEANYQVVKIVGATGQRLSVDLAQANSELNSATTIGVVTETINNNQEGFITYSGEVNEINTTGSLQGENWVDGDILYLSPTVAGRLTNIKPSAPNHTVIVGYVEYAHLQHGKIFVKVDNGYELNELHDVEISTYINKGVLYRDTSSNTWKQSTIADLIGEEVSNETPTGILNGVNSTFTIQNNLVSNSEKVYVNGHRQLKPLDYNISGQTITLTFSPESTETVLVDYIKQ